MKQYTLVEAQTLLPEVIPVLEELRAAFVELRAFQASLSVQARGASGDGHLLADPWEESGGEDKVAMLNQKLQRAVSRLDRWGIEIKDPEKGLIDFFHDREGRTVYLCFHLGEREIGFWHELNTGFAGRKAI